MNRETEQIVNDTMELVYLVEDCHKDAQKIAEQINRGIGGREIALAITKLQEARMWLNQAVYELVPKTPTVGEIGTANAE